MSTTQSEHKQPSRVYGWKPSLPSHPDNYLMVANPTVQAKFPPTKFLGNLPPVYDQGQLGSCTANALAGCFEFEQCKQGLTDFMPSRLFIYYNERVLENTIASDSGASLDDGIKTLVSKGVCSETTWPYNINKFATQPSADAFSQALTHQITGNKKMANTVNGFKTVINMGYPVAFGFTVYPYMESAEMMSRGILKMPNRGQQPLGGHAVVCIGYSDNMEADGHKGFLKVRNSWGTEWGIEHDGSRGYFWIPYEYVHAGLTDDLVVITQNEASMIAENEKMAKSEETVVGGDNDA